MMKQLINAMPQRIAMLMCALILSVGVFAQQIVVKGHVKDGTGEPITGATVRVAGQEGGVVTDIDGNFSISANTGAEITVSYIGYADTKATASANMVIVLKDDAAKSLNEVVVIGYGVVKKSDLTGSVSALKPDSKNKGLVVNPQDMLSGKVAGVNITTDGGAPGAGSTIRIRGGSSLNASNNPLIVIDGVAMDHNGVQGLSNPLSMINPQDIESFNVLKDASAAAIYGSRGSNGVIIITTKKGRKGMAPQISYNGSMTVSQRSNSLKLMNADEYRDYIVKTYGADSDAAKALGTSDTDWQKEIYRTALSHDHNIAVQGAFKNLPYRLSVGYTGQQGILKTTEFRRVTAALNLNPSFFDDHLTMNLNAKGMYAESDFANNAAISDAFRYDPTQSIYDNSDDAVKHYGGYFQWKTTGGITDIDKTYTTTTNENAPGNPFLVLLCTMKGLTVVRSWVVLTSTIRFMALRICAYTLPLVPTFLRESKTNACQERLSTPSTLVAMVGKKNSNAIFRSACMHSTSKTLTRNIILMSWVVTSGNTSGMIITRTIGDIMARIVALRQIKRNHTNPNTLSLRTILCRSSAVPTTRCLTVTSLRQRCATMVLRVSRITGLGSHRSPLHGKQRKRVS